MEFDFAVIYFGLTRSIKKVYKSHIEYIYNHFDRNNITYKKFIHTWSLKDGVQNVWENNIKQKIDYNEHTLLNPDFYQIDNENEFIESVNMDDYFYKNVWDIKGHCQEGEWLPKMVSNHICMLESQKRAVQMVENFVSNGNKFKFVMFIRPDLMIHNYLPFNKIMDLNNVINISNHNHHEGFNDQFAILSYNNIKIYGNRIDEIVSFRKNNGRIVGEKYIKFIINKYNLIINQLNFNFEIVRP
jgi:hypothetical protein